MPVFQNILQAIGNTPLVRLNKVAGPDDAAVYAKCEFMNPGGAIKDRMALYILDKAEQEGRIRRGGTIVENTSGNTGNSTGTEPEDNNNHWLDRQRSDYDQRHVVAASIVWK